MDDVIKLPPFFLEVNRLLHLFFFLLMLVSRSSLTLKNLKIPNNGRKFYYSTHSTTGIKNILKKDKVIEDIAYYAKNYVVNSHEAMKTSRYTIMDALGCGFLALSFKECKKLLGPVVEETLVPNGIPVPGTKVRPNFSIGIPNL